jgi:hypothetical protein
MKYFIDTEFLEGTQKESFPISLFRKNTPPTIDLISIGIVAEDGREYYAISKDFNLKEAWNRFQREEETPFEKQNGWEGKKVYWIRDNVLLPIWRELFFKLNFELGLSNKQTEDFYQEVINGKYDKNFSYSSLKAKINKYGKNNEDIAEEIISFTEPLDRYYSLEGEKRFTHGNVAVGNFSEKDIQSKSLNFHYPPTPPKFYAYYADYDWVAFCWLFGKMMDLPDGFPKYCNDLKQMLDEFKPSPKYLYCCNYKNDPNYPKQKNEHSAIDDARWNKKLHEFLNNL